MSSRRVRRNEPARNPMNDAIRSQLWPGRYIEQAPGPYAQRPGAIKITTVAADSVYGVMEGNQQFYLPIRLKPRKRDEMVLAAIDGGFRIAFGKRYVDYRY